MSGLCSAHQGHDPDCPQCMAKCAHGRLLFDACAECAKEKREMLTSNHLADVIEEYVKWSEDKTITIHKSEARKIIAVLRTADEPKPQASNLRTALDQFLRDQWTRVPAVPNAEPGSYTRGYKNGIADVLRGVREVFDKHADEPAGGPECGWVGDFRTSPPPTGDLAIARACLGNLYVAVENLGRVPSVPRDPDVLFAMREAARFLGSPYNAETKSASCAKKGCDNEAPLGGVCSAHETSASTVLPCGCDTARTAKWIRRQCGCLPLDQDLRGDPTDI